jgi:tetratricopeptide (TPR) repeat protein
MLAPRCSSSLFSHCVGALLLLCGSVTTGHAQSAPPSLSGSARWADSARVMIERSWLANDSTALLSVGTMLDRVLTAFPNDALLQHYRGYALYREALSLDDGNEELREATLLRAVELLKRSAATRPLAETQALLSSSLGTLAGTGMMAGMRYGPASSEAAETARTLGPKNPRVLLLAAISAWFTPSMWGGGKDKGYALLQQAIAAFATDRPLAPLPAWGHAEAYAWLGQMERDRGNAAAARAAYDRALVIAPTFSWVRDLLLPALTSR